MYTLNVKKREDYSGHAARRERRKGVITGVIYGKHMANYLFEVGDLELMSVLSKSGEHRVIDINADGNVEHVLIKDVQKDPVTHKPIHVDLQEVDSSTEVLCDIPIIFKNEGQVNSIGAVLQKEKSTVKVKCSANNIPNSVEVDLLKCHVGDVIRVKDLNIASDISVVDDLNLVVSSINYEKKVIEDNSEEESLG